MEPKSIKHEAHKRRCCHHRATRLARASAARRVVLAEHFEGRGAHGLGPVWGRFGVDLETSRNRSQVDLGLTAMSAWGIFGDTLGAISDTLGFDRGTVWGEFGDGFAKIIELGSPGADLDDNKSRRHGTPRWISSCHSPASHI